MGDFNSGAYLGEQNEAGIIGGSDRGATFYWRSPNNVNPPGQVLRGGGLMDHLDGQGIVTARFGVSKMPGNVPKLARVLELAPGQSVSVLVYGHGARMPPRFDGISGIDRAWEFVMDRAFDPWEYVYTLSYGGEGVWHDCKTTIEFPCRPDAAERIALLGL